MKTQKIKTYELYGNGLKYAYWIAYGYKSSCDEENIIWMEIINTDIPLDFLLREFDTMDWKCCGEIIENHKLSVWFDSNRNVWMCKNGSMYADGSSPMESILRVYVMLTVGLEMDIPVDLL